MKTIDTVREILFFILAAACAIFMLPVALAVVTLALYAEDMDLECKDEDCPHSHRGKLVS